MNEKPDESVRLVFQGFVLLSTCKFFVISLDPDIIHGKHYFDKVNVTADASKFIQMHENENKCWYVQKDEDESVLFRISI